MLGVILTNWCINWLCYNCLPRMAFLSPKIIFSIKRHYSNMCLRMVIHINSSKNPICLFPCCLITICTIFFLNITFIISNCFLLSPVLTEQSHRKHWQQQNGHSLTHVVCMTLIHPHENFTSAKDIQQGGLVLLYVQYIYIYIYGLLLHFKLCSITHVTCDNQSVHDITEFRVYIH